MSLLDEIDKKTDINDVSIRLEQRRMALIQEIEEALERLGWEQKDLAEAMGKEDSQITRLLSPSSNPTLKTLVEIESALDQDLFTVNRNIKYKIKARHLGENQALVATSQPRESGTSIGITSGQEKSPPIPGSYEDVKGRFSDTTGFVSDTGRSSGSSK